MEKNSVVLPDASFTPPPKTVVEVLWTCGVFDRVLCAEAGSSVHGSSPSLSSMAIIYLL